MEAIRLRNIRNVLPCMNSDFQIFDWLELDWYIFIPFNSWIVANKLVRI